MCLLKANCIIWLRFYSLTHSVLVHIKSENVTNDSKSVDEQMNEAFLLSRTTGVELFCAVILLLWDTAYIFRRNLFSNANDALSQHC